MKILIDISHPAHVHFFRHPMRLLQEDGHQILVTSRDKDCALDLLNAYGVEHHSISSISKKPSLWQFGKELIKRDRALLKVAKAYRPHVMAAIGGTFIAHVSKLTKIPSLVFYDTENAKLQNLITYPFASCVFAPECYQAWLPKDRHVRYAGYHELSYLHPDYFTPERDIALAAGLDKEKPTFLIRLVSWHANHDIGEHGWSQALLDACIHYLSQRGKVIISSESELPGTYHKYRYKGKKQDLHHLMGHCRLFIGESATMASECAVMGVPSLYVANTGRGYTDEQEARYKLVKNVRQLDWTLLEAAIEYMLSQPMEYWDRIRMQLLEDTIDVAQFVCDAIESFPRPLDNYNKGL